MFVKLSVPSKFLVLSGTRESFMTLLVAGATRNRVTTAYDSQGIPTSLITKMEKTSQSLALSCHLKWPEGKFLAIAVMQNSFVVQQPHSFPGSAIVRVSRSHTIRHAKSGRSSLERVITSSQRPLPAQHTTKTRGIRIRDASNQATTDLRLTTRSLVSAM
jgi:hypothetical protein